MTTVIIPEGETPPEETGAAEITVAAVAEAARSEVVAEVAAEEAAAAVVEAEIVAEEVAQVVEQIQEEAALVFAFTSEMFDAITARIVDLERRIIEMEEAEEIEEVAAVEHVETDLPPVIRERRHGRL